MSLINQVCRQVTNGCGFPNEIEEYIFHLLLKKKHLPRKILEDIILVKKLQDTLRFVFQNNELVGIFKEDEVDRGIGRAGYGTPPFIHSDIKIPSRDSTIKIINRLPAVRPILD